MYDLLIEDATIVSGEARQVADIAIEDGKIAYVGSRPAGRAREKLSAIGRFVIPGLIDVDVRLPTSGATAAEVCERSSQAAVSGGITTVIIRAEAERPTTHVAALKARRKLARKTSLGNFGFWAGAGGGGPEELRGMLDEGAVGIQVELAELDGPLHVDELALDQLFETFEDLLCINAQDRSILQRARDHASKEPVPASSPTAAVPPEAAYRGVEAVIERVRAHRRRVLLSRLSTAEEFARLDPVRGDLPIAAGASLASLFLSEELTDELGIYVRDVPPLRQELDRRALWTAMKRGRIDLLGSSQAAVPQNPKGTPLARAASGIPGFELSLPLMLSAVQHGRLGLERMVALVSETPAQVLGLEGKGSIRKGFDADLVLFREGPPVKAQQEHLMDPAGWSPYVGRELAAKPDLVFVRGRIVARNGVVEPGRSSASEVKRTPA